LAFYLLYQLLAFADFILFDVNLAELVVKLEILSFVEKQ